MTIEINRQLKDLSHRRPSGPDFTQSTLEYCDEATQLAIQKYLLLLDPFPLSVGKTTATTLLDQELTHGRPKLPPSDLVEQDGKFYYRYSDANARSLTRLGRAIAITNPQLIQRQYLDELNPPTKKTDIVSRHLWFSPRFRRIQEVAGLEGISGIDKILAAGFATQIAKNLTVDRTVEIAKSAMSVSALVPEIDQSAYFSRVIDRIHAIRLGESYISLGLATQQTVAKNAGLKERDLQLIMDIAFIRGTKGLENSEESYQMIDPIIRLIAIGDFEQAAYHRDFLLQYFTRSFPDWRVREASYLQDQPTYPTIAHLARAVQSGKLILDSESVPDQYQTFFGQLLSKKIHRLERVRTREILSTTQNISRKILSNLQDRYDSTLIVKRLNELRDQLKVDHPEVDSEDIDEGFAILAESGYDPKTFQAVFRGIVRDVRPERLEYLTDIFIYNSKTANTRSPKNPFSNYIDVTTTNGKPEVHLAREHTSSRSIARGLESYEDKITLGRFFYKLVEVSFKPYGAFSSTELQIALRDSFVAAQSAHPEHSWFTQQEYFNATLSQFAPSKPNPDVIQFFADLNLT